MKLLVVDFDGTLLPKDDEEGQRLYQENLEAVRKWIAGGNKFAIATARHPHYQKEIAEALGYSFDYIGFGGSIIKFESGEEIIRDMPASVFITLCESIKKQGIDASIFSTIDDIWTWNSIDNYPMQDERYYKMWGQYAVVRPIAEINPDSRINSVKIFVKAENRDYLKQLIIAGLPAVEVHGIDIDQLQILPENVAKGAGVKVLCEKYNIAYSDLVVIGDSDNDISMFELAKHSYCMSWAETAVQEKAARITNSVKEVIKEILASTAGNNYNE